MNEHNKGGGGAVVVILIVVVLLGFFVLLCVGAGVAFVFLGNSSVRNVGGPVVVRGPAVSGDLAVPGPAVSGDAVYGPTLSPAPRAFTPIMAVPVAVYVEANGQVRVGDDEAPTADVEDRLSQERDKHGPDVRLMLEISAAPDCPATVLLDFMRLCHRTGYCSFLLADEPIVVAPYVEQ